MYGYPSAYSHPRQKKRFIKWFFQCKYVFDAKGSSLKSKWHVAVTVYEDDKLWMHWENNSIKKRINDLDKLFNNIILGVLRVFWINIVKFELNLWYRNCWNLFGILRWETEFRYYHCRNSTKSMREKKKKVERENVEFRQRDTKFLVPNSAAWVCVDCPKWKEKKNLTN